MGPNYLNKIKITIGFLILTIIYNYFLFYEYFYLNHDIDRIAFLGLLVFYGVTIYHIILVKKEVFDIFKLWHNQGITKTNMLKRLVCDENESTLEYVKKNPLRRMFMRIWAVFYLGGCIYFFLAGFADFIRGFIVIVFFVIGFARLKKRFYIWL